ncbi:hypothetical protein KUCAC02_017794 [Chaenocephalus aceratus]|uniref:Uncharacterized protein n=1 Tax=Chaenocephalus aceratus TaxID=36190 RepID=A0ACB9W344_CHAAC|nr:hypothetical protein KUCAC02_017794 [Chaenocephalus aceratus]
MMTFLPKLLLLALIAFPATLLIKGPMVSAQDLTEDEEAEAETETVDVDEDVVDDATDEDDEAEVEDDENVELTEEKEDEEEEALVGEVKASPNADTTILFVKGDDFPANDIVKFLLGFSNKGSENFIVESLDASFRYPQDYQAHGGRPFGLVINLNYKDGNGNIFQDAVFNQTVTITEREDGIDGETIFLYVFMSGLGLLVVVGLHQLMESRKRRRPAPKVEMGTSSHNDVDLSWIPQETLNQIMQSRRDKASPKISPRKRNQKRSAGSDE